MIVKVHGPAIHCGLDLPEQESRAAAAALQQGREEADARLHGVSSVGKAALVAEGEAPAFIADDGSRPQAQGALPLQDDLGAVGFQIVVVGPGIEAKQVPEGALRRAGGGAELG